MSKTCFRKILTPQKEFRETCTERLSEYSQLLLHNSANHTEKSLERMVDERFQGSFRVRENFEIGESVCRGVQGWELIC